MTIAITFHLLAAIVWIGGMFFAYMALRPVAATLLEPPQRLPLWDQTFAKFFPWVWVSILLLLGSGYYMTFAVFGGFGQLELHLHIMQGLGLLMIAIFAFVFFKPYRSLKQNVAKRDFPAAGKNLALIRRLVGLNLILGLCNAAVGTIGRI